ncbi:metalloregulator ArsR/SmtB family transcription factor [Actinotalea sp. K2]|uniref:ArsR/SmtB family transcription factor n=1 Tax=Actinotalea sp. K2 TaxID=2939438 RepID=UPI00201746E7|nr:metalloregulator ArsR/SmtB family transcription factor [Actinotalea sp. K2]MCL3861089.1 metalloregulator ArsR/SmtB family transcription factor [Actinotalea sp. K2]
MSVSEPEPVVPPDLDTAVDVLRLLADQTRLSILHLLHDRELSVGAIADELDRPVPAVSQHLARLRAGRLVLTRRDGATVYYRHANEHVDALVRNVLHQAEHLHYDHPPHHR